MHPVQPEFVAMRSALGERKVHSLLCSTTPSPAGIREQGHKPPRLHLALRAAL